MKRQTILAIIFIIATIFLIFIKFDIKFKIKNINPQTVYKRTFYRPTVTVLLPSYNMAKTLPAAINSIINQTYTDWELLIINDGSSDKTKEILKPYARDYKIRIYHNRKNIGLTRTLNKGIHLARGKYIARLDADDYSLPDRLERQIPLMEKENLDLLSQIHYYSEKIENEKPDDLDTYSNGVELFRRVYFNHSSTILKKSFLTDNNLEYNLEYPNSEDYELWLAIFFNGGKMGTIGGQPVTVYRPATHPLSWWQTVNINHERIRIYYFSKLIPNFDAQRMLPLPLCGILPIIIDGNKTTKVLDQKQLEKQYELKCINH